MAAPAATPTAAADADSGMSAAATMAVPSSQSANGSSSSVTADVTASAVHAVPQLDANAFMSRMRALVSGLLQEQLQERARQRLQQQSQHSQQPGTALANNAAAAGANGVFQSSSMQHPVHRAQVPAPEGNPLAEYGGITSHAGAGMLHTYPTRTGQASASAPGPSTLSYLPAVAATGLPTASAAGAAPPGGVSGQGPHAVVGQPYGQQHGGSSTSRHVPAAHAAASAAAAHVSAGMQSLTIPVALPQSWSGPTGQEPLVIQINLILQPPAAAAASQQLPTELSLPLPPVAYMLPKQQPGVDMLQQQLLLRQQWTQPMLHCPDVLQLNVGGVPMAVTRSALEHARGSHLYRSLVIEYGLQPRDADGRIMLPYPAAAFRLLLGYLQQRANSTAAAHAQGISLASPVISSEQAASWRQSAEQTGISAAALAQVANDLGLSDIATSLARDATQTPRSSRLWSPESSSPPLLAAAAQGSTLRRASSPYEEGEQAGSASLSLPSTVLPGVDSSGTALPPGSLQDLMQQGREGRTDSAVASALFADTLRNQHACSPGRVAQEMHARTEPWGMEALQEWAHPGAPKVAGHLARTSSGGVPSGESPDPWVPSPDVPAMAQSVSSSMGMASAAAHPQQAVPRAAPTAAEMLNRDDLIALLIEQAGLLGIAVPSSVSPDRVAPAAVTGASSATAGTAMGSLRSSTADTPSPSAKGLEVSYGALSLPTYTPSSAHQPVAADVSAYGSGAGASPSMTHSPQALAAAAAAVRHGVGYGYISGGSKRSAMAVPPGVAVVPNMYELLAQKTREQAD